MATRNTVNQAQEPLIEVWRTGSKVGRTIYCNEALVGLVDTPELASRIVVAMNMAQLRGAHCATQTVPTQNGS